MAFGQRSAPWNLHLLSMWPDPADTEANIAWTRDLAAAIKPWTSGRAYLNFIGDEGLGRVEAAFGPEKYAPAAGAQGRVGPGEPVPPQPEHPADRRLTVGGCPGGRLTP